MGAVASDVLPKTRVMTKDDLDAVIEIENMSYPFPWTAGIFSDCLKVNYFCKVVEVNDIIIGYGVMSCAVGEAHILNICFIPEVRNKGYASMLLDELLVIAVRNGADTALLEVRPSNTSALNLYDSKGFVEVGTRKAYYPAENGREDAIILAKHLMSSESRFNDDSV